MKKDSNNAKVLKFLTLVSFIFLLNGYSKAQNLISIPFTNGFVGDNTAQNVSSNSKYLSSLGWTNVQFAQNTSGTTFTSQGNDIIGMVYITDANGVEFVINGYVKWRAPSGSVTALVFSPTSTVTLATNGSNGSNSYTISSSKYVGLIFNGMTLTIPTSGSNAGQVSGNAATTGLLTSLNDYLGTLPSITINDATVFEANGSVTLSVTLSASSTNQITVNYSTMDGSAVKINDYTANSGTLTFSAGQTSKTINLLITTDQTSEYQEAFYLILSDAVNASIVKSTSTIYIYDSTLPVELVSFGANCENENVILNWETASEYNSASFILERSVDGDNWEFRSEIEAAGNSNSVINYQYEDLYSERFVGYYRLTQIDVDGKQKVYDPIYVECKVVQKDLAIYPNPSNGDFKVKIVTSSTSEGTVNVISADGTHMLSQQMTLFPGINTCYFEAQTLNRGVYLVVVKYDNYTKTERLIIY